MAFARVFVKNCEGVGSVFARNETLLASEMIARHGDVSLLFPSLAGRLLTGPKRDGEFVRMLSFTV
jgi:hypothetical protein